VRIALVVSTYHDFVTTRLEAGARAALVESGIPDGNIVSVTVPGAYELAQAAHRIALTGEWQGVVCLGCLIRGETSHFDYIAQAASHGIMRAAQDSGVPIGFGLLTTNTAEEALARAGDGASNKGREAALAVIQMAALYAQLDLETNPARTTE